LGVDWAGTPQNQKLKSQREGGPEFSSCEVHIYVKDRQWCILVQSSSLEHHLIFLSFFAVPQLDYSSEYVIASKTLRRARQRHRESTHKNTCKQTHNQLPKIPIQQNVSCRSKEYTRMEKAKGVVFLAELDAAMRSV
jgi:hypothetical protein